MELDKRCCSMDIRGKLKSLVKEAELYRTQGLLEEARIYFLKAIDMVHETPQIRNKTQLLEAIQQKLTSVSTATYKRQAKATQGMSDEAHNLIKNMFTFSKDMDKETAALEGAIALAKFGQYEKALHEFQDLLSVDRIRVAVAKNIIRCFFAISAHENAVKVYHDWLKKDEFSDEQIDKVNTFLKELLLKKGLRVSLPKRKVPAAAPEPSQSAEPDDLDEEFLDISSIGILMQDGAQKGQVVELDVSFQNGNILNVIVADSETVLLESLEVGVKLKGVQFYSPIAIFKGAAEVCARNEIETGPKKGNYSLDIKVLNN